ncbi:long-chain fatty acid--CoA ligase [Novosphingobium sp. KCTC 2891]|uniref:class I adenylate-forming enzyme family protein n=1 Tax=Novosphingobium sp. KCTC 2891 TaxID=2989730 RepID=UPI002223E711|nr:long-chain fatty acid--CoA ligase [Novosphingobium sp. KCTC 2891]MCW1381880.1 long-chain fatty acid--CoA ligase [Novosphingobium sp. KCTC 2891]
MAATFSLTQAIDRAVRIKGASSAVVDGDTRFTWREFGDRVARLAAGFQALGLASGGRVVLLALNSHRSLECFFAAMHAGGVIVPLNHRLGKLEIAAQVADCDPDVIVVGSEFVEQVRGLPKRADQRPPALVHCASGPAPEGLAAFEDLIARSDPVDDALRCGEDLACLIYTSGTTNAAKGVMLSHANLCANTANVIGELGMDEATVDLHHGPLFHIASAARLFSASHVAGCHVILPRFVAAEVIAEIERSRITHLTLVPTMVRMLLDEPGFAAADLSSLRYVSYGSAAMPEPLLREFMERLPQVRFVQSYGMTELSPVTTILGWQDHLPGAAANGRLRSAGRAAMFAEVAVVGPDDRPLPIGKAGEIVARGPMVMQGYWNRPDLTAEALRGGWMHTGDIGYLDGDGYLFVVDRLKDMIITGGENVWSQEVENALSAHPAIAQCAVIGKPDAHWGETVHAVVTLKAGNAASAQELIDHCRDLLAHYKCPRSVDIRADPLPLSGANKILKAALREQLTA